MKKIKNWQTSEVRKWALSFFSKCTNKTAVLHGYSFLILCCVFLNYRLPTIQQEVQQRKLLYIGLYLLIWGEAANLRFLPECLCYIYHHVWCGQIIITLFISSSHSSLKKSVIVSCLICFTNILYLVRLLFSFPLMVIKSFMLVISFSDCYSLYEKSFTFSDE